ncbi:hypothetical protein VTI74DRAFT_1421 [Chaetomium olivicolor]
MPIPRDRGRWGREFLDIKFCAVVTGCRGLPSPASLTASALACDVSDLCTLSISRFSMDLGTDMPTPADRGRNIQGIAMIQDCCMQQALTSPSITQRMVQFVSLPCPITGSQAQRQNRLMLRDASGVRDFHGRLCRAGPSKYRWLSCVWARTGRPRNATPPTLPGGITMFSDVLAGKNGFRVPLLYCH